MDLNNKDNLQESFTEFPPTRSMQGAPPPGRFTAWFRKKFGRKDRLQGPGRPPLPSLRGDAATHETPTASDTGAGMGVSKKYNTLPQLEYHRKRRYRDYEQMEEFPEIGASLDIYADDCTQEHLGGSLFKIDAPDDIVKVMVEDLFESCELETFIWDISRNVVKYGECFIENIVDINNEDAGIQRIKILNPNYVYRKEDKYGYLKGFVQEVPSAKEGGMMDSANVGVANPENKIDLDPNQIVHFRLFTSDANYYPYGKSILAPAVRSWKSLRMLEDAMLIYRLHRAPERRVFYFETGNMPSSKVEAFIERQKAKFKKEDYFSQSYNQPDSKFNATAPDEDFYVPVRNGKGGKIDVLPGAQNLSEIDDVRYFRDKVLAAMKIPKDFIVEKDKSPERKANLSQLDMKFAKAIIRVQRDIETSLNVLVRRHLDLKGVPTSIYRSVKVTLAPPSDLSEKRRLELDEQKIRTVQSLKALELFPDTWIYENYFDLTEGNIEEVQTQMEEQMAKKMEKEQQMQPPGPEAPVPNQEPVEMPPDGTPSSEPAAK
jgi:hypothetical protein